MDQSRLDALLKEFATVSKDWFAKSDFVLGYHRFITQFFKPDNLRKAEWRDFQALGDNLHSLNSLAIAKGNAFGKPNFPIERYRHSFGYLAYGEGAIEERIRTFMRDKNEYASKFLGNSVVSELVGQLFPEQFVFMNRRDLEAADYLGIKIEASGSDFAARFIAFNRAISPVTESYKKVVGIDPDVPIGLAVDQFFSWIYANKLGASDSARDVDRQIWSFAPGPQAQYWTECLQDGIAPMGWDELGPLSNYRNKEDILNRINELWPSKGEQQTNNARSVWDFAHVVKPGDLIIAKRGNQRAIGLGVVQGSYRFDTTRSNYKHVRDVIWIRQGDWALPEGNQFATKTLTNISRYKDFVDQLLGLMGVNPSDVGARTAQQHFWLNCAPDQWRVSQWKVGQEQTYTTRNEDGNKRRIYACFQAARLGDLVVGYETSPVRKVTSLLTVTQGLYEEGGRELIRFRVTRQFDTPRSLADLRQIKELSDCEPIHGLHQGSLFQVTKAEYDAIVGDSLPEAQAVSEPEPSIEAYTVEDALDSLFVREELFRDWIRQWRAKKNLILQGPPGVGKTYVARRLAYALIGAQDVNRVALIQFHQSFGYEDFVQGYRPSGSGFDLRNGVFYDFCLKARQSPKDQVFVFIIDEINRGNLSKIFGELLMLVEADKRGEPNAVRLAYQADGQTFFVPENVFLLGMMNTADRSLAVVDYALRRRFSFASIAPAFDATSFIEYLVESCGTDLATRIVSRMSALNDEIAKDTSNLGPGFCIGQSYFCRIQSAGDYQDAIRFQIAPLLREYWFDQPKRAEAAIQDLLAD